MILGYEDLPPKEREETFCQRVECRYNNLYRNGVFYNACDFCVQTHKSRLKVSGDPDWRFCKCFKEGAEERAPRKEIESWMARVAARDAERERKAAEEAARKKANEKKAREMRIDKVTAYKLWAQGATDQQAATIMGISIATYALWRQKEKLTSNNTPKRKVKFDTDKARKLHSQGANDTEMAEALGVSTAAINCWRRKEDLPNNYNRGQARLHAKKMAELYYAGKTDDEIAEAVGLTRGAVQRWRAKEELAANTKAERKAIEEKIRQLHEQGKTVKEIAEAVGLSGKAIYARLQKMGIKLGGEDRFGAAERDLRGKLYSAGKTDKEIAEAIGKDAGDITRWRHRNGLPVNKKKK